MKKISGCLTFVILTALSCGQIPQASETQDAPLLSLQPASSEPEVRAQCDVPDDFKVWQQSSRHASFVIQIKDGFRDEYTYERSTGKLTARWEKTTERGTVWRSRWIILNSAQKAEMFNRLRRIEALLLQPQPRPRCKVSIPRTTLRITDLSDTRRTFYTDPLTQSCGDRYTFRQFVTPSPADSALQYMQNYLPKPSF